jgi:hypothetical protein
MAYHSVQVLIKKLAAISLLFTTSFSLYGGHCGLPCEATNNDVSVCVNLQFPKCIHDLLVREDLTVRGTFFTNEIDPCCPTTTTSFGGSINLPTATTANNGSLQIDGARFLHNYGSDNTFAGANAGNFTLDPVDAFGNTGVGTFALSNDAFGALNTAVGAACLANNTDGNNNTSVGQSSLTNNISGQSNVALGGEALLNSFYGDGNTAVGTRSLQNSTESFNTAVGYESLINMVGGSSNIALGDYAGGNFVEGNNNIYIGNAGCGQEYGVIRLGTAMTHTGCFIPTIANTSIVDGSAVVIDAATGKIGVGTPVFAEDLTVLADLYLCSGTLFTDQINPCSPETVVSVGGGLGLPSTTAANNGSLQINGSSFISDYGMYNTFVGSSSGNFSLDTGSALGNTGLGTMTLVNDYTGALNTAVGAGCLVSNDEGSNNTAVGQSSMTYNTSGQDNVACGGESLFNNSTGNGNTAIGAWSLQNSVDSGNTAIGFESFLNLESGSSNIGLGAYVGENLIAGSDNIYIGAAGVGQEDTIIRLGSTATHTGCFIAGISGQSTTDVLSSLPVVISADGKLGTVLSSRNYKKDIRDISERSRYVTKLRPVVFAYNNDPEQTLQYGLIAEEVAQVYPEIVAYDADGNPISVRYDAISILLLNEYLRGDEKIKAYYDQLVECKQTLTTILHYLMTLKSPLQNEEIDAVCDSLKDSPIMQQALLEMSENI